MQLTQKSGPRVASGFGSTQDFFCSGALETVDIDVAADVAGRTCKRGDALADATIFTDYRSGFYDADDSEIIALRKTR